jgi:hypothetical protein
MLMNSTSSVLGKRAFLLDHTSKLRCPDHLLRDAGPACGRLMHQLIVIGLRDELLAALDFVGELIPNGGDTSDTGNLEKRAFRSNTCNSG